MKIALVNQPWTVVTPPVVSASLPKWCFQFAQNLVPSHDVIYYARRAGSQKRVEYHGGFEIRRISGPYEQYLVRLLEKFPAFFGAKRPFFDSRLYYLAYAVQVARDLQRQQCDIVHILNFSQFVPIIRAFNPKVKIVLNMRCEWLTQLNPNVIERRLKETDLIIGCCEYVTDKIRRQYPHYADCSHTIHNAVIVDEFVTKKGRHSARRKPIRKILFVGRISPEKGLHNLLDAFKKVVEQYPNTQLEIVGPEWQAPRNFIVDLSDDSRISELTCFYNGTDYLSKLKGKLSHALMKKVKFSGLVPHNELPNHYSSADIFVHPSFADWFPKSIVEAMASGLPVVATDVGGIPEAVINGETGLLVRPGDVSSLANAILDLLRNEDKRKVMGEAGRQRVVDLFSWEQSVTKFLSKYKTLL